MSYLDGALYGTANAEATSTLLLAYNDELIKRLHKRQSCCEYTQEKTFKRIEELEDEIRLLKDSPWTVYPWPTWFTFLISSTIVLAITISAIAIHLKRLKSNIKRR